MARILVVDDEKSIRTTLREFIEEDGHEVLTAEDAEEALSLLGEDSFDIVVTDIILPRVTGVALLDRIRSIGPDVQVVMITGEPNVETAAAAVRAGAFDYLSKPISQNEIRAVIASAVRVKTLADRRAQLEEENRRYQEDLEQEVSRKTDALRASEANYRTLFENSPISLWLEDYSEVKSFLDARRHEMLGDPAGYFEEHPEVVDACIRLVRVDDVNEATLTLHSAESKEQLLGSLEGVLTKRSRREYADQLVLIAEGARSFEKTTVDQTLDGTEKHVALRWVVAPGSEDSLDRVLVSKYDITATVEAEAALHAALQGTIEAIGRTTETRDPYTAGHQRRVTELAVAIAEEMGLDRDRLEGMRAAGLMHDIGKMAVPAEILSKPSALTDMEMALIQTHPRVAYDILESVAFPWPLAQIVLQHHERVDGTGYPQGLRSDETLVEARILAVADTVEAMASHRPYRAALGIDVALAEIEGGKGGRYDPEAADACLCLFREGRFAFEVADPREA